MDPWHRGSVAQHEEPGSIANPPELATAQILSMEDYRKEVKAMAARGQDRNQPEPGLDR